MVSSMSSSSSSLFNSLTDDLIIHILSFLPTKYAVLTSVLSKRWQYFCCYALTNLHFDDHLTFHQYPSYLKNPDRISRFNDFIDKVLALSKVPRVQKFFLSIDGCLPGSDRPVSWVREIISTRRATEVEIYFSYGRRTITFLPLDTFNSETLTVLKLHFLQSHTLRGSKVNNSYSFSLPNLKVLHFWLDDLCSRWMLLVYLFRASPCLQEANVGGGLAEDGNNFYNIYAPSLKRLRMKFESTCINHDKFFVMAPMLEDLVVVDNFFHRHVIKTSSCLVSAKLDFGLPHISKIQGQPMYVNRVCKLLRKISHVRFLNLKAHTMDALSMSCNENLATLPQFHALHCLRLCFVNYSSWDVLSRLLQCTPKLEVLGLSKDFKGKDSVFRKDSTWIQPTHVPTCLLSCLRRVEVYDCESHQVEFSLISYLLKHGEVLNTFLVELLPANSREDLRFKSSLMVVPRASKACKLEISAYPYSSQPSCSSQVGLETELRHMPPQQLCYEDLRLSTNYFSNENLIARTESSKVYRGKFHHYDGPYGLVAKDVVVKKWVIPAESPFDEYKEESMRFFREELKLLQHPDIIYHPYFMSLLGYCVEDNNERLGMVYDFKPLDRLENLILKDSFSWLQRIKVALILACIVEYMHNHCHHDFPSVTPRINPASVIMDEDYMPVLFDFNRRLLRYGPDEAEHEYDLSSRQRNMRKDYDVNDYGLTLMSLISKRGHQCPHQGYQRHTCECVTLERWITIQEMERLITSALSNSQVPLVHKDLMDDPTYDFVDGLKITRLALRCVGEPWDGTSMLAIVNYLCKLRVVRENWDAIDTNNVISNHLKMMQT